MSFVSVASKGLRVHVSGLESTLTVDFISVDSKEVTDPVLGSSDCEELGGNRTQPGSESEFLKVGKTNDRRDCAYLPEYNCTRMLLKVKKKLEALGRTDSQEMHHDWWGLTRWIESGIGVGAKK